MANVNRAGAPASTLVDDSSLVAEQPKSKETRNNTTTLIRLIGMLSISPMAPGQPLPPHEPGG